MNRRSFLTRLPVTGVALVAAGTAADRPPAPPLVRLRLEPTEDPETSETFEGTGLTVLDAFADIERQVRQFCGGRYSLWDLPDIAPRLTTELSQPGDVLREWDFSDPESAFDLRRLA